MNKRSSSPDNPTQPPYQNKAEPPVLSAEIRKPPDIANANCIPHQHHHELGTRSPSGPFARGVWTQHAPPGKTVLGVDRRQIVILVLVGGRWVGSCYLVLHVNRRVSRRGGARSRLHPLDHTVGRGSSALCVGRRRVADGSGGRAGGRVVLRSNRESRRHLPAGDADDHSCRAALLRRACAKEDRLDQGSACGITLR